MIIINQAKVSIFLDGKVRLKSNQTVVATIRMMNLNELSNNRQVCLVPNPNSKSSAILVRSFSLSQNRQCVSVLLNTEATTVTIQRGKKLGYALPLNTYFQSVQNVKMFDVTKCPLHANKEGKLKRVNELNISKKSFPIKSETDDGLSTCSNFPERPTEREVAAKKTVLPEIEHLTGKISDKELDSLRAVQVLLTKRGPRHMKVVGHYIEVHGPYPILMNVDGINIYTKAHVTDASDQVGWIYLG